MKRPAVYILSNQNRSLYVGVTANIQKRVYIHRNKIVESFASRYDLVKLVYYEWHTTMLSAITREKQLKDWIRQKKVKLIDSLNPNWDDLWISLNA